MIVFDIKRTFSLQLSEDSLSGWQPSPHRDESHGSSTDGAGTTESWEFRSALEAPIARLESLGELESTGSGGGGADDDILEGKSKGDSRKV